MKISDFLQKVEMAKECVNAYSIDYMESDYELRGTDHELFVIPYCKDLHLIRAIDVMADESFLVELSCGKKFIRKTPKIPVVNVNLKFSIYSLYVKDFSQSNVCPACSADTIAEFKGSMGHSSHVAGVAISTAKTTYKECHKGTKWLWETPTIKFGIGGLNRAVDLRGVDLIINASGRPITDGSLVSVKSYGVQPYPLFKSLEMIYPFQVIDINWPDYGIPDLDKDFWNRLVMAISSFGIDFWQKGGKKAKIVAVCAGGHGRSGTAASILTVMFEQFSEDKYEDVIQQIRAEYCENIVETQEQVQYISTITNKTMKSKGCPSLFEGIYNDYSKTHGSH